MSRFPALLLIAIFTLAIGSAGYNYIQHSTDACYSEKDFFKRINEEKLVTLVKSESDAEHYIEVMITPYADKEVVVVEYHKDALNSKDGNYKFCVKSTGVKSNINKDIIEELYQAIDKLKGTRTGYLPR